MEEQTQRTRRSRLILVPCPYQGHINPMLQLATFLHSKGFSITVVHTHFNSPNPSNHPEFRFEALPDYLTEDVISSGNLVHIITLICINCQVPFREWLAQTMKAEELNGCDEKTLCVIYDELMYFAESAANQLKLQSIILRTTSAATAIARIAFLRFKAEGQFPLQDPASPRLVPKLHPLRFKDLPTSRSGMTEEVFELIGNMYNVRTSSAIIMNTTDCLDHTSLQQLQQQCKIPFFPIGPLHKTGPTSKASLLEEDESCIEWLNNQARDSVIYVSFGSIASMDNKELAEMAWGLANSKQPFLWVVRPKNYSETIDSSLPNGSMEAVGGNGYIVKWAPQKEVLAHSAVGGFWTHCGWNSTLESICEGVPMICRPCFGDQKVNSRYVSYVWRVGLEFENVFERGEIEKAVRRLMVEKEGEEMRQRAKVLQEKVELSIREGGSSYNACNDLLEFIESFKLQSSSLF